jgi:hypothetical protein
MSLHPAGQTKPQSADIAAKNNKLATKGSRKGRKLGKKKKSA